MANKTCRPITFKELELIVMTLKNGYSYEGVNHRPNVMVAFAFWLESVIGLRVGDICRLTLQNFYKKNERDYYLRIREQKTNKFKDLYIPLEIYETIVTYCLDNNINRKERIIKCSVRNIQKQLKAVADFLNLGDDISTHSGRKMFSMEIMEVSNNNLLLLQSLLMHSSVNITKRYVSVNTKEQKDAMEQITKGRKLFDSNKES